MHFYSLFWKYQKLVYRFRHSPTRPAGLVGSYGVTLRGKWRSSGSVIQRSVVSVGLSSAGNPLKGQADGREPPWSVDA
jgi:hypothetical protein